MLQTANAEKMKQSQRRGIRLLLFLTIIHTLPAVWLMPVAGGTAIDSSAETEARKWLEAAAAGNYGPGSQHDNRHDWNLDPQNYNHFPCLESRLKQAKFKLAAL